ncbi:alkaline phosphatase family protein [Antrihabitans stalactiti]|nr:alkaline phosphatase family protein [Antrihabitans stalactiti]
MNGHAPAPSERFRPHVFRTLSVGAAVLALAVSTCTKSAEPEGDSSADTATPIRAVVCSRTMWSFDHYFGTYPAAINSDGPRFTTKPDTPLVDGLTPDLLAHNPNQAQPMRLGGNDQQVVCDQDHKYLDEEKAFHGGAMDQFVEHTEVATRTPPTFSRPGMVMDYYDGNSVIALWNYAHYSMSDNSYNATFGPSTPGALNLVSGQTHGVTKEFLQDGRVFTTGEVLEGAGKGRGTVIGDPQPFGDECSTRDQVQLSSAGKNIGDLLKVKGVTWGFFQGGFKPTERKPDGPAVCGAAHDVGTGLGGTGKKGALPFGTKDDYIPITSLSSTTRRRRIQNTCRPAQLR